MVRMVKVTGGKHNGDSLGAVLGVFRQGKYVGDVTLPRKPRKPRKKVQKKG